MSIFVCGGHGWRSKKGLPCPRCIEQEIIEISRDRFLPCKVKTEEDTRYATNPNSLPLHKDMIIEGSLVWLDDQIEDHEDYLNAIEISMG